MLSGDEVNRVGFGPTTQAVRLMGMSTGMVESSTAGQLSRLNMALVCM